METNKIHLNLDSRHVRKPADETLTIKCLRKTIDVFFLDEFCLQESLISFFEHRNSINSDNSFRVRVHWTASCVLTSIHFNEIQTSSYNLKQWNSQLFSYFIFGNGSISLYAKKLDEEIIQGPLNTTLPYMEASVKYRRACLWRLLLRFRRTKKQNKTLRHFERQSLRICNFGSEQKPAREVQRRGLSCPDGNRLD